MDVVAVAAIVLSTCAALLAAPDLHAADLVEPTVQACVVMPVTLAALMAGRIRGWPAVVERGILAVFLGAMPTVYLLSLALHGGGARWLAVEIAGQVLFGALAVVGFRSVPWLLVAGIAAHGLLWDAWHHGRTPFVPDWYTVGCLVVDVGWAGYAASRVAVWRAADRAPGRMPASAAA